MKFSKLLDGFCDYLIATEFKSAADYKSNLEKIYKEFPGARHQLDKIANENNHLKQLKYCTKLIESVYNAKEIEKDSTIKSKLGDWHSVVTKFFDFIYCHDYIIPGGYILPRNINVNWDGEIKKPHCPPLQGEDQPTQHVYYAENVLLEQQVPGLCVFLENEYERIFGFARQIFWGISDALQLIRIPVILKKECPSRIYLNSDDYVTKKINELIDKGETISTEVTKRILRYEMRITGKFFQEPVPHIEIYFRQIKASCWEEYASALVQTLAHEYAHYLEYVYCKEQNKKYYQDARVSEAIADFFGVLYSVNRGGKYDLKVDEDRYNLWKKREESGWPYAYALYFLSKPYKVNLSDYDSYEMEKTVKKLREVFQLTPNAKDAYLMLIN